MTASSAAPSAAERALLSMKDEAEERARLERLVATHFSSIWRFLRRLGLPSALADDAAQDVFLIASRRASEIRTGSEYAFLVGTALRVARGLRRKREREPVSDEVDVVVEDFDATSPEQMLDDQKMCALAYRLLEELDEDLRQLFVLYEIEGLTMPEIAQLTGLTLGTANSRLRRARQTFRLRFERHRKRLGGTR